MSFSKLKFGKGRIWTAIVEDIDGRELQKFKVNEKDFPQAVKILSRQFGLKIKILEKESNDLDWAI